MNIYSCNKCYKIFPDKSKLNRHLNMKRDCSIKNDVIKYNNNLLKEIIIRDGCIIEDIPELLKGTTEINYQCSCGNNNKKKFVNIYKTLAICKKCSDKNNIIKRKKTCLEKYGKENYNQTEESQEKRKKTCLEKYGKEHYLKTEESKEKRKKICLEKYGVENISQSKEIKQKKEDKSMEKYGVKNISQAEEIKQKKEDKSIEKYGTKCVFQSDEIKNKTKLWSLKKYGTEHPRQNAEYAEKDAKNTRQWKDYKLPSGTIMKYQGYENFAYDELFAEGFTEKDIITSKKNVPEIWYTNNDKNHRYFVDIYIPSINKMIEVKSTWTYKKKLQDNIIPKAKECIKRGYNYEIWIYDNKKNKIIIDKF